MSTEKQPKKKLKSLLSAISPIIIGLAIGATLNGLVIFNAIVPTESMETTIMTNDRLIGLRLAYLNSEPERGDIITFDYPDNPKITLVKRIVGLPGETITIVDGEVFIDGDAVPLDEPYINPAEVPVGDFGPYVVPDGCYFVLGDNRNHSVDSRYWESTHFVSKESITSKIFYRYYPSFSKINE